MDFFTNYKDVIVSVTAIATMIGVLITSWGVFQAQKHIKSDLIYNLQKDGREILAKITEDEDLYDYLRNYDDKRKFDPKIKKRAHMQYHIIVNYYNTVFDQKKIGTLDEERWEKSFLSGFCGLMQSKSFNQYWIEVVQKRGYADDFKNLHTYCKGS